MKLKYNLIAWSLLGFFAAACDPMDDIYNEIDAEGTTNTQTMAEYVLTDADYETISSAAAKAAGFVMARAGLKFWAAVCCIQRYSKTAESIRRYTAALLLASDSKDSLCGVMLSTICACSMKMTCAF